MSAHVRVKEFASFITPKLDDNRRYSNTVNPTSSNGQLVNISALPCITIRDLCVQTVINIRDIQFNYCSVGREFLSLFGKSTPAGLNE